MALAQAAAYIRETNTSIAEYLASYKTAWNDLMKDESHPDFAPREYDYRSVYTTWSVSIECVKQKNEDAVSMLQLWSCLDNKDVWFGLFNNKQNWNLRCWCSMLPQWFQRVMGNDVAFRRAVRILLAYSLIEAKEDSDAFAMHPVVHDWCRETLDAGRRHEFIWLAITVVGFATPHRSDWSYWEIELRLLPHTSRCIALLDNLVEESLQSDDLLDLAEAVRQLGNLFQDQTKLAEAETMYQRALESDKKHFKGEVDQDSDLTIRIYNALGCLYSNQKKLDKAEAMFQRALTGFKELSGSDTRDTMMAINNLGVIYQQQGKLAEAEAAYKRALAWYMDTLGSDDVDTADVVNNLGYLYRKQGKLAEAESPFKRALVVQEDKLGPEHPLTLDTVHNLGNCHQYQEKFVEAEIQYERALLGREKILGPDHRDILDTCYGLGNALLAQEKFVEAEIQFERALSGFKNNKDYKWTKEAAMKLSTICKKQRRLAEAEAIWRPLLAEFEAALGPDDKLTLDVCFEIGLILVNQDDEGKLLEAEAMFQRALSGYKKVLGMDHNFTVNTLYNLGLVLQDQGKLYEAEDMFQQALLGDRKIRGTDHPYTKKTAERLSEIYEELGREEEAEAILQSVS